MCEHALPRTSRCTDKHLVLIFWHNFVKRSGLSEFSKRPRRGHSRSTATSRDCGDSRPCEA
eukprot:6196341-Pleurochrysis_carterae.AAC.1